MPDSSKHKTLDKPLFEQLFKTHFVHLCNFAYQFVKDTDSSKDITQKVKSDKGLSKKISDKYKIKNTCGYGLNSLTDFDDPFDVITPRYLLISCEKNCFLTASAGTNPTAITSA